MVDCNVISVISLNLCVQMSSFTWLLLLISNLYLPSLFGHKGPALLVTVMDNLAMILVEWVLSFSSSLDMGYALPRVKVT